MNIARTLWKYGYSGCVSFGVVTNSLSLLVVATSRASLCLVLHHVAGQITHRVVSPNAGQTPVFCTYSQRRTGQISSTSRIVALCPTISVPPCTAVKRRRCFQYAGVPACARGPPPARRAECSGHRPSGAALRYETETERNRQTNIDR